MPPAECSGYKLPIQACLCKADNCIHVTLKMTRTKDALLILLDLLLETYRAGFAKLVGDKKISSEKDMLDLVKKKYGAVFVKHIKAYELLRKMKSSREMKAEEEYRRHVRIIFDDGLVLDIDKGKELFEDAKEFMQLVLDSAAKISD